MLILIGCPQISTDNKEVKSACIIGDDGIGRRNTTIYEQRPRNCKCERLPVRTVTETCGKLIVNIALINSLEVIFVKSHCFRLSPAQDSKTVR